MGLRTPRDHEQAPKRHLEVFMQGAKFVLVTSKCQLFLQNSDLSTDCLAFPALGTNRGSILSSSHALLIHVRLLPTIVLESQE